MSFESITPEQAVALIESPGGAVYLDVRSRREFRAGHPRGAINIPIAEPDDAGQMAPNPEFLSVAGAILAREAAVVVGCQSGKRSEMACRVLASAGYARVSNVAGGFGGAKDMLGRLVQPGWVQLGLPVSDDNGDGVSYESLRARALGQGDPPR